MDNLQEGKLAEEKIEAIELCCNRTLEQRLWITYKRGNWQRGRQKQ